LCEDSGGLSAAETISLAAMHCTCNIARLFYIITATSYVIRPGLDIYHRCNKRVKTFHSCARLRFRKGKTKKMKKLLFGLHTVD